MCIAERVRGKERDIVTDDPSETGVSALPEQRAVPLLPRPLRKLAAMEEVGVLAGFLAICLGLSILTPDKFVRQTNLLMVARQASQMGILALGMVMVISMGDIDLSIGSIYNLVVISTAWAMRDGMSVEQAVFVGLIVGAICGFMNGALSVILRLPTIIVTLGTMSIYRGLGLVLCSASPIYQFSKEHFFFKTIGGKIGAVPGSVVVWVVMAVLSYVIYARTAFGRRLCAIGSNLQAARFAGITITRIRLVVMTLMGIVSAISGLTTLAFLEASDPSLGQGYELFAIASAIIGGAALAGGAGSMLGAVIGALIIAVIRNGVVLLGISMYWNATVTGAVIIAAVAIDYFIKRRRW